MMQRPAHTISIELQLQHDASGSVLPTQSMLQLYKANVVPKTKQRKHKQAVLHTLSTVFTSDLLTSIHYML
jgi:hypothetical protein